MKNSFWDADERRFTGLQIKTNKFPIETLGTLIHSSIFLRRNYLRLSA